VQKVFTQLTGLGKTRHLKQLIQAPFTLHKFILEKIEREIAICKDGGEGRIIARMNSLVDPAVIEALYKASKHGVKIDLIVRGICVLKPQVPGLSENIRVVSVLGRFLEHSRVFYFFNGGAESLYLSSADWMPRNFFNRVEIAIPVEGESLDRVKDECLDRYLADNCFSWELQADGQYHRRQSKKSKRFSAQLSLIEQYSSAYSAE